MVLIQTHKKHNACQTSNRACLSHFLSQQPCCLNSKCIVGSLISWGKIDQIKCAFPLSTWQIHHFNRNLQVHLVFRGRLVYFMLHRQQFRGSSWAVPFRGSSCPPPKIQSVPCAAEGLDVCCCLFLWQKLSWIKPLLWVKGQDKVKQLKSQNV